MVLYTCQEDIGWVVEVKHIILIQSETGSTWTLSYPDATIWDLLTRNYSFDRIVYLLATVTSIDLELAEQMVLGKLDEWLKVGILTSVHRD